MKRRDAYGLDGEKRYLRLSTTEYNVIRLSCAGYLRLCVFVYLIFGMLYMGYISGNINPDPVDCDAHI